MAGWEESYRELKSKDLRAYRKAIDIGIATQMLLDGHKLHSGKAGAIEQMAVDMALDIIERERGK